MAAPLRILLADDQIPWDTNAENLRTKAEIRREFAIAKPHINVDVAFEDDYRWFSGLLVYLERTKGEKVIRARTFKEARQHLENPRGLDVAIVDLSWWGDYTRLQGASERENCGFELLPDALDVKRSEIPIVSLSQNFSNDFELMSTVLERGALPVPKNYQAPELSYRALYAAIQYLTRGGRGRGSTVEVFISHAHGDKDLAKRLVRAIEVGLHVPANALRCTSVPGYGFEPGTDFVQALKAELTGARCVVGLWTPISTSSQWCLFELGAAWGLAHKTLFLSLGGETLRDPPAGFKGIQASQMTDAGELRRFLEQLQKATGWPTKNRAAAEAELEELAQLANGRTDS
jgi:hypothetical protein